MKFSKVSDESIDTSSSAEAMEHDQAKSPNILIVPPKKDNGNLKLLALGKQDTMMMVDAPGRPNDPGFGQTH